MKSVVYRKPWDFPRDHQSECQIYSHGLGEEMPAGLVQENNAVDDWLWVYFHHEVSCKKGGRFAKVPAGGIRIWAPGQPRSYGHSERGWTHTWFQCSGPRVEMLLNEFRSLESESRHSLGFLPVEKLWRSLHAEVTGLDPEPRILGNLLENGLRDILRGNRHPDAPGETRLLEVKQQLDIQTGRAWSLSEMARLAGMSASHFSARFRSLTGQSPVEYHLQRRMDTACHLLSQRALSVEEVGEAVGYPDPASFSRMFKRRTGVSPRGFRHQIRAERDGGRPPVRDRQN